MKEQKYHLMYNEGVRIGNGYDKEPEPIVPAWEQKKKSKVKSFDLHPDIPMSERHNFDLANNQVEEVNKKERFHRNYAAIKVLRDCQNENRFATPDEQKILSRYVGWGGIPEAFDERAGAWHTEYAMLKNILTPEEYASARESTLTAFYTPPEVSTAIYKVLEQMGFQEGNLLEPSCGIGNFIGMLPKSMENAKVYGVELDTISAGIAQQLYQKSSIAAQGFEEVNVPDSFFDGIIGNVPFGDFKVSDKRYDKYNFLIHDYFFAKSLDKLRPGGVMALVTSKGTMDKENSNVRKYIAQRAELLGAIRLPNDTFKGNAGTEVVSDILFLQKRDRLIDIEPDWVHLDTDENGIRMNSYFVQHPEMILGEMKMVSGRFGPEATCEPFENADLSELLNEAVSNIHGEISEYEVADELEEEDNSIPADPMVRNFSYTVLDDKIYFRENSRMSPVEVSATAENRIKGMIGIRDCVRNLIELQTEDYPDSEIKQAQDKLNTLYDSFTKKYGLINSRANTSAFSDDSSYALLSALEVMLLERKKQIDEMKELFGDEYLDYDLVFCHSSGRPMEGQVINRALKKLIQDNDLPDVVFHSFRHASITYKLKWNGGDMKSVQGDSGHARMDMVADVYSHIIDEDRRYNAQKFEEQFYNAKGLKNAEEGKTAPMPKFETSVELLDPMAEVQKESEVEKEKPAENSTDENAALLTKLLSNPETAALLKALAKTI